MPVFRYQAVVAEGTTEGFITADTPVEGRSVLRKRGLTIVRFIEQGRQKNNEYGIKLPTFGWGSYQALNEVLHYLVMLLKASVPLGEALNVLVRQTPRKIEPALRRVAEKVNGGEDFANALADEKDLFDVVFVGIVRVGQASGQLDECLQRLVRLRQRRHQLRQRVTTALAYPAIVTAVGCGVVTFLLTFVVPRITMLIKQSGRLIPWPTQFLLTVTELLRSYWWTMPVILLLAWLLLQVLDRRYKIWTAMARGVIRVPVLGAIVLKSGIAQISIMLETMLRSGLPLDEAIEITKRSVGNPALRDELETMLTSVRSGRSLISSHAESKVFPPVVVHVLSIGDQTGQMEDMLAELAQTFDADVDTAARRAVAVLEPTLIVVLSVVVGFIVFATILPILRLSSAL